jgi:hypothetical protein
LQLAFNASNSFVDATNGRIGQTGSGGITYGVGPFGKRISSSGSLAGYRSFTGKASTAQYTVAAVVLDSAGRGAFRNPIDSDDSNGSPRFFQLRFNTSNQAEFIPFNTGGTPFTTTGSTASSATGLSVILASVDSAQAARVYLNGKLEGGPSTITGSVQTIAATNRIAIGNTNTTTSGNQPFTGDIYGGFFWNRCLTASEILSFSQNPWQLFASLPRRIWAPSTTSGTSYTITPSGGITFAGGGVEVNGKVLTVSGGVTFSGNGNMTFASGGTTYTITPSGGITFAGSGLNINSKVFLPTGGITFAGTGLDSRGKIVLPAGGVTFSGSGSMSSNTSTGPVQTGERTKVGVGT